MSDPNPNLSHLQVTEINLQKLQEIGNDMGNKLTGDKLTLTDTIALWHFRSAILQAEALVAIGDEIRSLRAQLSPPKNYDSWSTHGLQRSTDG